VGPRYASDARVCLVATLRAAAASSRASVATSARNLSAAMLVAMIDGSLGKRFQLFDFIETKPLNAAHD
jgi:hypothetical protein